MEYTNLKTLIDVNIKNFINEYKNTMVLFENSEVKNKLLHPGEYGLYKEALLGKLLEFALPKRFSCGTGFVVNSNGGITSQCDIILYDELNTPFMKSDGNSRFYPQEVVYGIGEVKSKLTSHQLCKTMIKLAENKKIRQPFINAQNRKVDPETNGYDAIFTFLICDEIIDWNNDIALEIQREYIKQTIITPYWFNIIISLKNGVIAYDAYKAIELVEEMGVTNEGNVKENDGHLCIALPCYGDLQKLFVPLDFMTIVLNNEVEHVKEFLVLMNEVLVHSQSHYPDPKFYLYNRD